MHPQTDPGASAPKADRPEADDKVDGDPNRTKKDADRELDHGLKETFPASDPVSINPGAD